LRHISSSQPYSQTCQQSSQIKLINQAEPLYVSSQANPAYGKKSINQAQTSQLD
jgi:hypothetical protein